MDCFHGTNLINCTINNFTINTYISFFSKFSLHSSILGWPWVYITIPTILGYSRTFDDKFHILSNATIWPWPSQLWCYCTYCWNCDDHPISVYVQWSRPLASLLQWYWAPIAAFDMINAYTYFFCSQLCTHDNQKGYKVFFWAKHGFFSVVNFNRNSRSKLLYFLR